MKKKKAGPSEMYRKHRPTSFKDVIGQDGVVKTLGRWLKGDKFPHAVVVTGPSGCGKTTIARIARVKLGCSDTDYKEINAANYRNIEMIRQINNSIRASPMAGRSRVWCIDEAHQMTKEAQHAVLKVLEDPPDHAYIILCTTEPTKLLRTIITRCNPLKIRALDKTEIKDVIRTVLAKEVKVSKEDWSIPDAVVDRIADASDGSARQALVFLDKVLGVEDEDEMLDLIQKSDSRRAAFDLVKLLLGWGGPKKKVSWTDVRTVLDGLRDEDPEGVRRLILACLTTEVMRGGPTAKRAAVMFDVFRDNFFDTGFNGLVFACYAVSAGS